MNPVQLVKDSLRFVRNRVLTEAMLGRLREHQASHERSAILIATPKHGNLGDQAIVLAREALAAGPHRYSRAPLDPVYGQMREVIRRAVE